MQKTIVISGTTSGLGRYLLKYFESLKYDVVSINRFNEKRNIKPNSNEILINYSDINKKLINRKLKNKNIVMYLSCAGNIGKITNIFNDSYSNFKSVFDVNLLSQIELSKIIIKNINNHKLGGSIIFFSGGGATSAPYGVRKYLNAYSVSKIGLIKFVENLSHQLNDMKNYLININIIAPGQLKTKSLKLILNSGEKYCGKEFKKLHKNFKNIDNDLQFKKITKLIDFLSHNKKISGKVLFANYDIDFKKIAKKSNKINDFFTLRRIQ